MEEQPNQIGESFSYPRQGGSNHNPRIRPFKNQTGIITKLKKMNSDEEEIRIKKKELKLKDERLEKWHIGKP